MNTFFYKVFTKLNFYAFENIKRKSLHSKQSESKKFFELLF